jgi:hypothetical protein
MTRSKLEHEGARIIALDVQNEVMGAVLLLYETSALRHLA